MEIEKKYRVKTMPDSIEQYERKQIEQGYLCVDPVVRIRKSNEEYILTYKSKFGLKTEQESNVRICNEVEVPLNESGYTHLKEKIDGQLIKKSRYIIPLEDGLKAELDVFHEHLEGLVFVEVEFPEEEVIDSFVPPQWFGEDVTSDKRFSNHYLASIDKWEE